MARRSEAAILGYRIAYLDHGRLIQLFREIFVYRLYDVPLKSAAPRIIDCGSNIGMSIIFFKNLYPDAHITGFEPQPLVFQTLQGNVERNSLHDVVLHQKALSDTAGTIEFFVKAAEPGALNASVYAADGQTAIQVQADRLSSYIDGDVDLLKLDIEGAEEVVLKELEQQDKLRHVSNIACEYHHHRNPHVDRLAQTLAVLERAGFGYHVSAAFQPGSSVQASCQQDLMIYAYRKNGRPAA